MYQSVPGIIGALLALGACLFAFWRGRAAERWAAAAILAGWMSTPIVQVSQNLDPEWGMFWVDVLLMAIFVLLIAVYRRGWLAFAAAFQLLLVATHWAMLIDHRVTMGTYIIVMGIWSFAILIALVVGTLRAGRRAADENGAAPV